MAFKEWYDISNPMNSCVLSAVLSRDKRSIMLQIVGTNLNISIDQEITDFIVNNNFLRLLIGESSVMMDITYIMYDAQHVQITPNPCKKKSIAFQTGEINCNVSSNGSIINNDIRESNTDSSSSDDNTKSSNSIKVNICGVEFKITSDSEITKSDFTNCTGDELQSDKNNPLTDTNSVSSIPISKTILTDVYRSVNSFDKKYNISCSRLQHLITQFENFMKHFVHILNKNYKVNHVDIVPVASKITTCKFLYYACNPEKLKNINDINKRFSPEDPLISCYTTTINEIFNITIDEYMIVCKQLLIYNNKISSYDDKQQLKTQLDIANTKISNLEECLRVANNNSIHHTKTLDKLHDKLNISNNDKIDLVMTNDALHSKLNFIKHQIEDV
jgi:hypothetical protein